MFSSRKPLSLKPSNPGGGHPFLQHIRQNTQTRTERMFAQHKLVMYIQKNPSTIAHCIPGLCAWLVLQVSPHSKHCKCPTDWFGQALPLLHCTSISQCTKAQAHFFTGTLAYWMLSCPFGGSWTLVKSCALAHFQQILPPVPNLTPSGFLSDAFFGRLPLLIDDDLIGVFV